MSTVYTIIGFFCFWGTLAYIARETAIFLFTEKLWPSRFLGHLNFYVFQWFGFRFIWGAFLHRSHPISLGIIFVWPLSGFNKRPFKPNNSRQFYFYKKYHFSKAKTEK